MADPDRDGKIFVGKSDKPEMLALAFGNRHGLVTGATGTGKTVTLQTMAEGFSRAGVPVFAADIKGDLSGIAAPGEAREAFVKRAKDIGFEYETDEFTDPRRRGLPRPARRLLQRPRRKRPAGRYENQVGHRQEI